MIADATDIQEMDAISITLIGENRRDGSVFIHSPELPIFSAVGANEEAALESAMALLGPYLEANVPDYVDLRKLRGIPQAWGEVPESILPAHVIACRGGGHDGCDAH